MCYQVIFIKINQIYLKILVILIIKSIQAGYRGFEIHSTIFCCPNYHLNLTLDACVPCMYTFHIIFFHPTYFIVIFLFFLKKANHKINTYQELIKDLIELNSTVCKYIFDNETKSELFSSVKNRNETTNNYLQHFNEIYNELINDSLTNQNKAKYTIYLWDNNRFLDYINSIMNYHEYDLRQKLEKIIITLKNHLVKQHHITQSIVSNQIELETLAGKHIRLSKINGENVIYILVYAILFKYNLEFQLIKNRDHSNLSTAKK